VSGFTLLAAFAPAICFAVVFALVAPRAAGQSTGSIVGQVTDLSGAVVPGAKIIVTGVETGVQRPTTSTSDGYYSVPSLAPANYIVSAEIAGFKKTVSAAMKVDTTATVRVDLTLAPQDSKVSIDVSARAPALETETSMTGDTVTGKELTDLPLNGRNSLELAMTVAGVQGEMGSDEAGIGYNVPSPGSGLSVNGGRPGMLGIMADGMNATSIAYSRATVTFSPDNIAEFKVISSSFSAKYGVTGGGIISTVSKSGEQQLHGSAFWFTRNPALTARTFYQPTASGMRRNEMGVTLGGPVLIPKIYTRKQKTFFFASYEPKRRRDETAQWAHVPTQEERNGDFRNSWVSPGSTNPLLYQQVNCVDPACSGLTWVNRATSTTVYPLFCADCPPDQVGHVIPKNMLDPVAQIFLKYVPLPNMPYNSAGQNFVGVQGVSSTDNRWNVKLDHNVSDKNHLSARFTDIPNMSNRYNLIRDYYMAQAPPSDQAITRQAFLSDTDTVSSRIVNEFRGSVTHSNYTRRSPGDLSQVNYTKNLFGLPNSTNWGFPRIYAGMINLGQLQDMQNNFENQYQAADDVTIITGRHNIQVGVDLRSLQQNTLSSGLLYSCCGSYDFTSVNPTSSGNSTIPTGSGGYPFASFLLGVPNALQLTGASIPYYYRYKTEAAYLQDDIKASSNLTLNLGVRWQYVSPRTEKYNRQATLDIDHPFQVSTTTATGAYNGTVEAFNYIFTGAGTGSDYLEPTHKKNFEPRVGFAWTPHSRWTRKNSFVIRGGYGISHTNSNAANGATPYPAFGLGNTSAWNYTQWTGTGPAPVTQAANPNEVVSLGRNIPTVILDPTVTQIPAGGKICQGCVPADPRVSGITNYTFVKRNNAPYIQTWNLTTQWQMRGGLVASIGYMGQKGTHLSSVKYNINEPDPTKFAQALDQGIDPTQSVPDPYGRVNANGSLKTMTLSDLMRPWPTVGDVQVLGITNDLSIYHAGTVSLERRFASGIGARFNYTYSKSIDTGSDSTNDQQNQFNWGFTKIQDPGNLKANRSVSLFDSRHRFNLTMNSDLPFGKGKAFLSRGRWVNQVVGGWSLNAVASLYSGRPFPVTLGDANGIPSVSGVVVVRPDLVQGVPAINPLWTKEGASNIPYFNPLAFARPAYGKMGDAPRTLDWMRTPWQPNLNASLAKNIYPFENRKRYAQLRFEAFNALNHTWFTTNPNSSMSIFTGQPTISRTGLSLAGQIPYLFGPNSVTSFPVGSRESLIAQRYNSSFGVFNMGNNNPGRTISLSLKLNW
jgi:hypothetical protein